MNKNKRTRKLITIRNDEKLKSTKIKSIQEQDINAYQKVLRRISHCYIDIFKDAKNSSDKNVKFLFCSCSSSMNK